MHLALAPSGAHRVLEIQEPTIPSVAVRAFIRNAERSIESLDGRWVRMIFVASAVMTATRVSLPPRSSPSRCAASNCQGVTDSRIYQYYTTISDGCQYVLGPTGRIRAGPVRVR
jgi:hypothetical protein